MKQWETVWGEFIEVWLLRISIGAPPWFANSHLLLLLACQLHLLTLFLHLWGGQFLLLIMGSQELLSQADELWDHGGELSLLLCKTFWSTCDRTHAVKHKERTETKSSLHDPVHSPSSEKKRFTSHVTSARCPSPLKYSLYMKAKVSYPRDRTANKASAGKQSLVNRSAHQRYKKLPQSRSSWDQRVFFFFFFLRGQDRASKFWASKQLQHVSVKRIPKDHRRRSGRETLAPSKPRMESSKQPKSDNGKASLKVRRSRVPHFLFPLLVIAASRRDGEEWNCSY